MGIKKPEEIEIMAEGGKILATVLHQIEEMVKPGITTLELDRAAEALILKHGAKPAFKGFDDFPYSLCASVNDMVVHGLPSEYVLKEGDIIGLDLGVLHKGYNTDMAITVGVGTISSEAKHLMRTAKEALKQGIKKVRSGVTTGDVGNVIGRYIENQNYGIVQDLCGHGIGKSLHEDPKVPNYGDPHKGVELKEGMVICIEPMVNMGDWRVIKAADGYGYSTRDGQLSAHFEHTLAITKNGCRVLTEA